MKLVRPGGGVPAPSAPARTAPTSVWRDYVSGVLTNVLNPKVGLFFIAFFPQFIRLEQLESIAPFFILGLSYAAIGLVWLLILTWLAGSVTTTLRGSPRVGRWLDRVSGAVFVLMGARVALERA